VPIENQIGSEILSDKFATVSECEIPVLRDDARAFLESEIRSGIPAGDGRCSRVMLYRGGRSPSRARRSFVTEWWI
jgi:hypothetical protein